MTLKAGSQIHSNMAQCGGDFVGVRASLKEKPVPKLYKQVPIQFLTVGGDSEERYAQVQLRENEMVLSISRQPSPQPVTFFVRGKKVKHFFAGKDSLTHEISMKVIARWALIGDEYIGRWIEDGMEYLFSFRLSPASIARRRT
jgi:intein/homing endonuclease